MTINGTNGVSPWVLPGVFFSSLKRKHLTMFVGVITVVFELCEVLFFDCDKLDLGLATSVLHDDDRHKKDQCQDDFTDSGIHNRLLGRRAEQLPIIW